MRRKRISSISQRVAVTVSVMAFGSVVESYSCANPIRALLRVYFRTRIACITSSPYAQTRTRARQEGGKKRTRDRRADRIIVLSIDQLLTY